MSTTTIPERNSATMLGTFIFAASAVAVLLLAFLTRFSGFTINDQAYALLRYTDHVLAGEGMTWNVGQGPVYGTPALGYVFALIPFRLLFPANAAAAVFCSSFFWGMVALALLFRMVLRVMQPSRAQQPYLMGLAMVALVATAGSLRSHFASGLETTFLMAYLAGALSLTERLRQGRGNAWIVGALLGMAWWVRPELLVLTLGIPVLLVWLEQDEAARKTWQRVTLAGLASLALCIVSARLVTGAWLPLSLFTLRTGLYGHTFTSAYRLRSLGEASRFLARNWPLLLVLGMGVYVKWGRLREAYSPMEKAVLLAVGLYTAYVSFAFLQVMGYSQRYYYPAFPFLLYLAARELMDLQTNLRLGPGIHFKRVPQQVLRVGGAAVAAVLLYYGINYGQSLRTPQAGERLSVFSAVQTYRQDLQGYWARLDHLQSLPPDLRIGSTEVGMPAALFPDHPIDDLAALHSPALMQAGLTADAVLRHCPADLIYMPHEHYEGLCKSLASSADFGSTYTILDADRFHASMDVAIRRNSPHAPALYAVFGR